MATRPGQLTEMAVDIRAMAASAENEDIREQLLEIAADLEGGDRPHPAQAPSRPPAPED